MDYKRLALAAVVTWIVDSIYSMVVWMGMMGPDIAANPGVFRAQEAMQAYMPLMFAGGLVGIFALVYIYAKGYEGGGIGEGVRFGAVMGVFMVAFVNVPLFASMNVNSRFGMMTSIAGFAEMLVAGIVIGVMYRPAARPAAARAGV